MELKPDVVQSRSKKREGKPLYQWIAFSASNGDLSSCAKKPPFVTSEELDKHKSISDCWMCLGDKVYNLTPYVQFHPGGISELMRGAGKDATSLFFEAHKWVNYDQMLKKCYIAPYRKTNAITRNSLTVSAIPFDIKSASFTISPLQNAIDDVDTSTKLISYEIYEKQRRKILVPDQTNSTQFDTLALIIKPTNHQLTFQKGFVSQLNGQIFSFLCYLKDLRYCIHIKISNQIRNYCKVKWENMDLGTLEINFYYTNPYDDKSFNYRSRTPSPNDGSNTSITNSKGSLRETFLNLNNSNSNNQLSVSHSDMRRPSVTQNLYSPLFNNDRAYFSDDYSTHLRYYQCFLIRRQKLTHDTHLFSFMVPAHTSMKCPLGYHVYIKLSENEKDLIRPYTPVPHTILLDRDEVYSPFSDIIPQYNKTLNFIIKIYPHGGLTTLLDAHIKTKNDSVWISDFVGDFDENLLCESVSRSKNIINNAKNADPNIPIIYVNTDNEPVLDTTIIKSSEDRFLILITAGTGITPALQILHRFGMENALTDYYNKDYNPSLTEKSGKVIKETVYKIGQESSKENVQYQNSYKPKHSQNSTKAKLSILLLNFNKTSQDVIWNSDLASIESELNFKMINFLTRESQDKNSNTTDMNTNLKGFIIRGHRISPEIILYAMYNNFIKTNHKYSNNCRIDNDLKVQNYDFENCENVIEQIQNSDIFASLCTRLRVCVCGSYEFNQAALTSLTSCGIKESNIYIFAE